MNGFFRTVFLLHPFLPTPSPSSARSWPDLQWELVLLLLPFACSSLREIVVGKEPRICTWGRKKDCARFLRSSTIWKEEIEEREKYKHENIPWCASLVVINLLNAGSTRHEKKLSTFYRLKQSSFSTNVVTFSPHEKYLLSRATIIAIRILYVFTCAHVLRTVVQILFKMTHGRLAQLVLLSSRFIPLWNVIHNVSCFYFFLF